jgi:iron complex outermembrane recepter protein
MNLRLLLLALCVCLWSNDIFAQTVLKGKLIDNSTLEPLAGVSIVVENTETGTTTDENGSFSLPIEKKEGVLIVSSIGYQTLRLDISKLSENLNISLESNRETLNDVVVTGFSNEKRLQDVAGSVGLVSAKDFQRANSFSLKPVLDLVPGVRVDQSNLSETRISIRGVGVRSAFGNRNLKFYINDIPITEADGFTRIEGIDIATLGKAEVIKGPASSIYGFGTGGVINFQVQKAAYNENSLEGEAMLGSYGFKRVSSTYRIGNDKMNVATTYGWQEYEGYRKHSNDTRRFLTSNMQFYTSEKQTVSVFINRTEQLSQIPGALTLTQVDEDRQQANSTNVQRNARRNQVWTRIGVSHNYQFSSAFSNTTSLFTSFYDLDHPLAFAYIRSGYQSYGGRSRFVLNPKMNVLSTKFIFGGEYLNGFSRQTRYVNNNGVEGNVIFNADNDNTQYSVFAQTETKITQQLILTLGASYNSVAYSATDYLDKTKTGKKTFEPQITPRVALSYLVNENHSVHASVSQGFAPPTGGEVNNADGTINQNIRPETGTNYEVNAKGSFFSKRLAYDLSVYRFNLKDELIPQTVAQNVTIYNNAGKTYRNGVELGLYFDALKNKSGFLKLIKPFMTLAYSDFKFEDYKVLNAQNTVVSDFSNNALTGITPWAVNVGFDIETKHGLYLYTTFFYNDKTPMNDANTDYNKAYQVLNTKLGYRHRLGRFGVNGYVGVDNVLNELYSSQIALNARSFVPNQPAPYFNPSPERMWYGGVSLKYYFTK